MGPPREISNWVVFAVFVAGRLLGGRSLYNLRGTLYCIVLYGNLGCCTVSRWTWTWVLILLEASYQHSTSTRILLLRKGQGRTAVRPSTVLFVVCSLQ